MLLYTKEGTTIEIEHAIDIKAAIETGRYFTEIKKEKKQEKAPKPEVKIEDKPEVKLADKPVANPYVEKDEKIEPKKAGRPKKEEVKPAFKFNKDKDEK